jgi:glycerol-3-phosphate dehydrogenase (NAD(P)+)
VATAAAVVRLADRRRLEMPICRAVAAVLDGELSVDAAIAGLLQRAPKAEGAA